MNVKESFGNVEIINEEINGKCTDGNVDIVWTVIIPQWEKAHTFDWADITYQSVWCARQTALHWLQVTCSSTRSTGAKSCKPTLKRNIAFGVDCKQGAQCASLCLVRNDQISSLFFCLLASWILPIFCLVRDKHVLFDIIQWPPWFNGRFLGFIRICCWPANPSSSPVLSLLSLISAKRLWNASVISSNMACWIWKFQIQSLALFEIFKHGHSSYISLFSQRRKRVRQTS